MAERLLKLAAAFVLGFAGLGAVSAHAVAVRPAAPPLSAFVQTTSLVSDSVRSDPLEKAFLDNSNELDEAIADASASDASPVPVPPALALFGGALAGLAVLARKRKRAVKSI